MFIRFRATATRLQLSVIETSRRDGKVRQHHVASLGSLPREPLPSDRVAFWTHVDARLGELRLDAPLKAKLRGEIAARVPVPTARGRKRSHKATPPRRKRVRKAQAAPQVALKDTLKGYVVDLSEANAALKARIAKFEVVRAGKTIAEIRYIRYTATLYDLLTAYAAVVDRFLRSSSENRGENHRGRGRPALADSGYAGLDPIASRGMPAKNPDTVHVT